MSFGPKISRDLHIFNLIFKYSFHLQDAANFCTAITNIVNGTWIWGTSDHQLKCLQYLLLFVTFPPGRPKSFKDCIIIFSVLPEAKVRVILKIEANVWVILEIEANVWVILEIEANVRVILKIEANVWVILKIEAKVWYFTENRGKWWI